MKIHLKFKENSNITHSKMTLFINGKNCGEIITSPPEAIWLHHIISHGVDVLGRPGLRDFKFESSGSNNIDEDEDFRLMEEYNRKWNNNEIP